MKVYRIKVGVFTKRQNLDVKADFCVMTESSYDKVKAYFVWKYEHLSVMVEPVTLLHIPKIKELHKDIFGDFSLPF